MTSARNARDAIRAINWASTAGRMQGRALLHAQADEIDALREFAEYAKATFHALEHSEGYERAQAALERGCDA